MGIDEARLLQIEQLARTGNAETELHELKREWFNLQEPQQKEDFCRLVAGMANMYGPDKYLIFGIGNGGGFFHAPLDQSGIDDIAKITDLLHKVKPPVQFAFDSKIVNDEGTDKTISIIRILPSIDKPHEINYLKYPTKSNGEIVHHENYFPIRKNGRIQRASRTDIDLMYWDRKNVIPAYRLDIQSFRTQLSFGSRMQQISVDSVFIVQNLGQHAIGINFGEFNFLEIKKPPEKQGNDLVKSYKEKASAFRYSIEPPHTPSVLSFELEASPLIIPVNELYNISMSFLLNIPEDELNMFRTLVGYKYFINLNSVNGQSFQSEIVVYGDLEGLRY